mgnify:CR=1 FL=1
MKITDTILHRDRIRYGTVELLQFARDIGKQRQSLIDCSNNLSVGLIEGGQTIN